MVKKNSHSLVLEKLKIPLELEENFGDIDHTRVSAPYFRIVSATAIEDNMFSVLYDLRVTQPNREFIDTASLHSLEHLLAVSLSNRVPGFLNFGPMGCQTGFYLTCVNNIPYLKMFEYLILALNDVMNSAEVPLCNVYQCGNAANHDLSGAKTFAYKLLQKSSELSAVFK